MLPKFEIKWSSNKQYYYNLIATNWKTILTAETYTTKQNCINWINSVKMNSKNDNQFKRYKQTKNNIEYYYYILESINWQPIWNSEMYTNSTGSENWIESVKNNAHNAIIDDLTIIRK
jgi:uncharacterized protein YegP (UPF0339 family)